LALDGEQLYRVPSALGRSHVGDESTSKQRFSSDAVQLFVDRARVHSAGFVLDDKSAPAVVSICAQLDGIPLALELAAARMRSLSVTEVDTRLADRFRLLTGGSRTALPRQRTLRATMDWSYESLNERDRAVFDRLSVFSGGFDLAAAETVCTCEFVESYEVIDAISALVDKSLVRAEPNADTLRYGLLETSRQYATERLATDGAAQASAHRAHALYFLELAEVAAPKFAGTDQVAWRVRLETELGNLRAAGAQLLSSGATSEALRFGVALRRFWISTGNHRWGFEHVEEALGRPDANESPALAAKACSVAARLCSGLALSSTVMHESEVMYIERGLSLARADNDDAVLATLLCWKAYVVEEAAALSVCDDAVVAARRSGDEASIAHALNTRGDLGSNIDDVRVDLTEAAEHWDRLGDLGNLARTLINLGDLELELGNRDVARAHLERGLELADPVATTTLLQSLVLLALLDVDIERAARFNAQFLGLPDHRVTTYHVAHAVLHAALCLSATGKLEHVAELHGSADALADSIDMVWDPIRSKLRIEDHARLRLAIGQCRLRGGVRSGSASRGQGGNGACRRTARAVDHRGGTRGGHRLRLRPHERADHESPTHRNDRHPDAKRPSLRSPPEHERLRVDRRAVVPPVAC
jgi:predicted ATPase